MNESNFQHILRVLNTNLDGKVKVMFALTSIKGVGRRFSNVACKKAEVDLNKRCAPAAGGNVSLSPAPPPHSAPLTEQRHGCVRTVSARQGEQKWPCGAHSPDVLLHAGRAS